ncbi:hypothetical protein S40288_05988 [Stachybotrys chartarum IBT 40288]|nr:hypothetical protein S40288_05988 [Stachybotrys chartarum IBT 40288]
MNSSNSSTLRSNPPELATHLAPDQGGNLISMNASWTKISCRIIEPDVLKDSGERYEVRLGFVAILGRLTREDVEDYARKTADYRAARGNANARSQDIKGANSSGKGFPRDSCCDGDKRRAAYDSSDLVGIIGNADTRKIGRQDSGTSRPKSILKKNHHLNPQKPHTKSVRFKMDKRYQSCHKSKRRNGGTAWGSVIIVVVGLFVAVNMD